MATDFIDNAIGYADLHIHTKHSWDSTTSVEKIVSHSAEMGLDIIAVTDHNVISGAYEAKRIASYFGDIEIIIGEEIFTKEGHLLALFIEEKIKPYKSAEKTIREIHSQGGLAIIPHPLGIQPWHFYRKQIERVLPFVDAIEVWNPTWGSWIGHHSTRKKNERVFFLPVTGGSDAHLPKHIGRAVTVFPGNSAPELKISIQMNLTSATGEFWSVRDNLLYFKELGRKKMKTFGNMIKVSSLRM